MFDAYRFLRLCGSYVFCLLAEYWLPTMLPDAQYLSLVHGGPTAWRHWRHLFTQGTCRFRALVENVASHREEWPRCFHATVLCFWVCYVLPSAKGLCRWRPPVLQPDTESHLCMPTKRDPSLVTSPFSSARRDRCGTRLQLEAMRRLPDAQNLYPFIFDGNPGFGPFRDTLASLVMPGLAGSGGGGSGGAAT